MKFVMTLACLIAGLLMMPASAESLKVKLSKNVEYAEVIHLGKKVRIQRIQDTQNRLIDDFAKTSRPCPPFCIQPITPIEGISTMGEMELIAFLEEKVNNDEGILIDARMPKWHQAETIPGSINIPFVLMKQDNPYMGKILTVLGAKEQADGHWDFSEAKHLALFCNGPWCGQSPRAIRGLMAFGYPEDKLNYYRGGMNLWRLLGLTTIVSDKEASASAGGDAEH